MWQVWGSGIFEMLWQVESRRIVDKSEIDAFHHAVFSINNLKMDRKMSKYYDSVNSDSPVISSSI